MKLALSYSTKDRIELTEQTIGALHLEGCNVDTYWNDGSTTVRGRAFPAGLWPALTPIPYTQRVTGGADAAIVFALTRMLSNPEYTHVGLIENDVLLPAGWLDSTMELFAAGERDGLVVGAASARSYEDRVLVQRDAYAVMHNLGAGHVIFTRQAAELVLAYYRTGWWSDNRKVFSTLSGIDIGHYACFRHAETHTTCDWHWDAVLAQHGLASLAVTPSGVQMLGQDPPLEEQGLKLVDAPVEERRNDSAFEMFRHHTRCIREGWMKLETIRPWLAPQGSSVYFAHQVPRIGGVYNDRWRLKWSQGFGGFSYVSTGGGKLTVPVFGPLNVSISGGEKGAKVKIVDRKSGYEASPDIIPEGPEQQVLSIQMPGGFSYREIEIEADEGARLFAVQTTEPQPWFPEFKFDCNTLPPVRD